MWISLSLSPSLDTYTYIYIYIFRPIQPIHQFQKANFHETSMRSPWLQCETRWRFWRRRATLANCRHGEGVGGWGSPRVGRKKTTVTVGFWFGKLKVFVLCILDLFILFCIYIYICSYGRIRTWDQLALRLRLSAKEHELKRVLTH